MIQKGNKIRLDEMLLRLGLVSTLARAKAIILAGQVLVNEQRLDKPGSLVLATDVIRIKSRPFVSRGGEKLRNVIDDLNLSEIFKSAIVLDVGASTGGFTDCCLKLGAEKVLALDIGKNQLHWSLRQDLRVIDLSKTDIREFEAAKYPKINIVVADVSFNRFENFLSAIVDATASSEEVHFLLLVKPQFELNQAKVPKGGIVKDAELRQGAIDQAHECFKSAGLSPGKFMDARPKGRFGNAEVFYYFFRSKKID